MNFSLWEGLGMRLITVICNGVVGVACNVCGWGLCVIQYVMLLLLMLFLPPTHVSFSFIYSFIDWDDEKNFFTSGQRAAIVRTPSPP